MSLDNLITRLEFVADKCRDPKEKKKKEQDEAQMDEFTRLKKHIAQDVKETRKEIEERNSLLGETSNSVATAKQSSAIRSRLKEIETDTEKLKELQEKHAKKLEKKKAKGKATEDDIKESEYRTEIIDLCYKHIAECKHLEKQGYANNNAFFEGYTKSDENVVTSLPDIDDADFQLLRQNDAKIDAKLDQVGQGVEILKNMALEMGKEIELQGVMISELDGRVDQTQAQLNNLNRRLKNTLDKVRKGNRFCIDVILVIILLALGGYIYNIVKTKA